jgi:hypothetical protein
MQYFDWTPIQSPPNPWDVPQMPPFKAVPAFDPPPAVFGQTATPLSNGGSANPGAFQPGPGTGHPGW